MTYLRNNTTVDQWLDATMGIKRKVGPQELVWVTAEAADKALRQTPGIWTLVAPIALSAG